MGDTWVAGSGVSLCEHRLASGAPRLLTSATVAIPWAANAQIAEAIGCRTTLGLLLRLRPDVRVARVVGDNLAVSAGTARLRNVEMQAHLEIALG